MAAGALAGAALGALGGAAARRRRASAPARRCWRPGSLAARRAGRAGRGGCPGPRRQVDERWLDAYRGWVYGLGYGAQLGAGVTTVVTSAATYVALLAALLSADAGRGALILGVYGAIRGLTPLAGRRRAQPGAAAALPRAAGAGRAAGGRGGRWRCWPPAVVLALVLAALR